MGKAENVPTQRGRREHELRCFRRFAAARPGRTLSGVLVVVRLAGGVFLGPCPLGHSGGGTGTTTADIFRDWRLATWRARGSQAFVRGAVGAVSEIPRPPWRATTHLAGQEIWSLPPAG